MPVAFQFPARADLWVPAELDEENTSRTSHNYSAIGRLCDGVSLAQANADLSAIAKDIIRRSPEPGDYLLADAAVVPLHASLTRRVGSTLYVLLGAVLFLLLVACANVTNLLFAQTIARQRELAIRHALGAGRGRLVPQLVSEALVLLALGGIAGLLVASIGMTLLLSLAPGDLPRLDSVAMDRTVLGFAIGLSAFLAVVLGVLTSMRAVRRDARDTLADGAGSRSGSASSQRFGRGVVALQMAITIVLLIGAALLGRSLLGVLSVDPGFRTDGIVAADLALPSVDDPAAKARLSLFYADLFGRLRAIPGVEGEAAANAVPLEGGLPDGQFLVIAPQDVPTTMEALRRLFQQKEKVGTADYRRRVARVLSSPRHPAHSRTAL
jgi:putative ABC transport system permease protein